MKIARLNSQPEIFYSLQGEGVRCGTPTVFLRLAGCNLSCSWCDTKYSWGEGIEMKEEEIARAVLAFSCPALVITGGEPLMQANSLSRLLPLLPNSLFIEIETNGTFLPPPEWAERINQWNISPKLWHSGNAGRFPLRPEVLSEWTAYSQAWFKFVVRGEEDWPAIEALELPRERIILMPCASRRAELEMVRPMVAAMCLRHQVRLGDRLHLVLWDNRKGV